MNAAGPINDLLTIVASELGRDRAELLRDQLHEAIARRGRDIKALGDPSEALDDAERLITWHWLWEPVAAQRPASFAVSPARIGADNAAAWAFSWARRNDPHLRELALDDAERLAMRRGRALLRRWTGLDTLRPCRTWVAGARSRALGAIPAFQGAAAWSYAQVPVLRRQTVINETSLRERRGGGHPALLASVLLHEELHAAFAAASRPGRPASDLGLAWELDEMVVRCCETAVTFALFTATEPTVGDLRGWVQESGWNLRIIALLDRFDDDTDAGDMLRRLAALNVTVGRRRNDQTAESAVVRSLGAADHENGWQAQLEQAAAELGG